VSGYARLELELGERSKYRVDCIWPQVSRYLSRYKVIYMLIWINDVCALVILDKLAHSRAAKPTPFLPFFMAFPLPLITCVTGQMLGFYIYLDEC